MFPQINKKQMGQRLKRIVKRKKVLPKTIQQFLGLSCVQTVYRWMEGVNVPCIDHLYALSILLEVTLDELVAGKTGRSNRHVWGELRNSFFVKMPVECSDEELYFQVTFDDGITLSNMGLYYGKIEQLLGAGTYFYEKNMGNVDKMRITSG